MVRVLVDDVVRAEEPLEVAPAGEVLAWVNERQTRGALELLAVSASDELVRCYGVNPFFWAIEVAYQEHRPLVLTPDAFWLTIAQGLSQHIALNEERLRPLLVGHDGKKTLEIRTPLVMSAEDWADGVVRWSEQIAEHASAELVEWVACDFSTSGPVERIAGKVMLMSALRHFFDYRAICICGIPEVELRGTVEDWEKIRARIALLDRYGMELWASRLRPICDGLVQTARGEPDLVFWQNIYLPQRIYGASIVVGWCADLFPYLKRGCGDTHATTPNQALEVSLEERLALCEAWLGPDGKPPLGESFPYGMVSTVVPCAGAMAPIRRVYGEYEWDAALIGGVLGVRQRGLWLEPVACWMVREQCPLTIAQQSADAATTTAARELAAQCSLTSSGAKPRDPGIYVACPDELDEVFAHVGAGELYGGSWALIDPARWAYARIDGFVSGPAIGRLSDGRALLALVPQGAHKSVCVYVVAEMIEVGARANSVDAFVVVATSFVELMSRLREADGAFFMDAPGFVPPVW